jgi:ribosomal protein S18 acetylase RimI-like enzyme
MNTHPLGGALLCAVRTFLIRLRRTRWRGLQLRKSKFLKVAMFQKESNTRRIINSSAFCRKVLQSLLSNHPLGLRFIRMQELLIRPATHKDLPALLQFEQGVIDTERAFDPTLKSGHTQYYDLPYMIEATHIKLLVAVHNGNIVGSGYARIEAAKPYLQHSQHAYLGFMYVLPEYRGKGVNKAIISALENWALETGVTEMRLEVYTENAPAIKAYEKAGFLKHMLQMRKAVKR